MNGRWEVETSRILNKNAKTDLLKGDAGKIFLGMDEFEYTY